MSWPSNPDHACELEGGAVRVWLAPDGGITIRAIEPSGDPVEIGETTARELARALVALADLSDRL